MVVKKNIAGTKMSEESQGQPLEVTIELFLHLTSPVFPGGLHALVVG